ncbi:hypothetical protein RMSM_02168 [Rhodopirellula maiorica SM1]|uniref:Uncharacterized protein n=1 Tax=Rhodopirellula maiorica SM1 TaxID=1265738 RepID=M5S3Z4_9BACT|nr:hypothetical protein RMSM_02168 [Rhodopirellula maiorica SM1]
MQSNQFQGGIKHGFCINRKVETYSSESELLEIAGQPTTGLCFRCFWRLRRFTKADDGLLI